MADWGSEATFFLLAAIVQEALGFAIILRRPRVEWAVVLGALFVLNGALSLNALLVELGVYGGHGGVFAQPETGVRIYVWFDRATTLLIAYLALAYPKRPSWAAARPGLLPTLFLLALASLAVVPALDGHGLEVLEVRRDDGSCQDPCIVLAPSAVWSRYVLSFGFPLLLWRWSTLLPKTRSPLELQQFKLIFAAFAVRGVHVELLVANLNPYFGMTDFGVWQEQWAARGIVLGRAAMGVGAILLAATVLLVRGFRRQSSESRRATGFVLAFMGVGLAEFVVTSTLQSVVSSQVAEYLFSPLAQLDMLVLRPALVFYAMLQYDLFGPMRHRDRVGMAAVAVLGLAAYTAGMESTLTHSLAAPAVTPLAAVVGGGLLAWATVAILRPFLRPDAKQGLDSKSAALERFVAELEDAYRNGEPLPDQRDRLADRRLPLGISREQAEALELAVRTRWAGTAGPNAWRPGETLGGRYRVEALLGEGGAGEAHLATDLLHGERVVLKRTARLDEAARTTLVREAFVLARLKSPHIIQLLRTERFGQEPILVLEHAAGGSLATRLTRGPLTPAEAGRMADNVLRALQVAHEAGLVHRDVKPSNILMDGRGAFKLGDFGVARNVPGLPALVQQTVTGQAVAGSLRYMSPEQVMGMPVDVRSDLFSFGMVLAEAVGGEPLPSHPGTDYDVRRAIVEGPVPVLPAGLHKPLATVVKAATRRSANQRPPSARHMLRLL